MRGGTLAGAWLAFFGATAAHAQETTTFSYDALGRLTGTSVANGPNDGVTTGYNYDPAGNRSISTVSVPAPPVGPVIADWSFEIPSTANFTFNPSASGTSFIGNTGVAVNGSAFSFAPPPNGSQVGFLQTNGATGSAILLDVTNLTPGTYYAVTYQSAARPGFGGTGIGVSFQGTGLSFLTSGSTSFSARTVRAFYASSASGTLIFRPSDNSFDTATAIDSVTIAPSVSPGPAPTAGVVVNASFESPSVGGNFQYNPSVPGNYFGSYAGVAANGSAWSFATAPGGVQVGFIQGAGTGNGNIVMNVSGLTVGATYAVRFYAARRLTYTPNLLHVTLQGNSLGYYAPTSTSFSQLTTSSFVATSDVGALSFAGSTGGDSATGIDLVTVTAVP